MQREHGLPLEGSTAVERFEEGHAEAELIGTCVGASGLATGTVIPIPYDFDFSGFVNPPYATPPEELHISDVRQRYFRGYCVHNAQSAAVAAQMRAARPQLLATLASTPGLDAKSLSRAQNYLNGFFNDIGTDAKVAALLSRCIK